MRLDLRRFTRRQTRDAVRTRTLARSTTSSSDLRCAKGLRSPHSQRSAMCRDSASRSACSDACSCLQPTASPTHIKRPPRCCLEATASRSCSSVYPRGRGIKDGKGNCGAREPYHRLPGFKPQQQSTTGPVGSLGPTRVSLHHASEEAVPRARVELARPCGHPTLNRA